MNRVFSAGSSGRAAAPAIGSTANSSQPYPVSSRLWPGSCATLALLIFWLFSTALFAQSPGVLQASRLEAQGRFSEAAALLQVALDRKDVPPQQREQLEYELDKLRRIKLDFPYTDSALFDLLKKSVRNLTRQEYDQWVKEGRFDSREIDGQRFFMVASVSNLFFRYPELYDRRLPPKNSAALEKRHWEICADIKKQVLTEHQPYVLPKRFEVSMTVAANSGAVPDEETIRAWIPIPRHYPFQTDFSLVSSSPSPKNVDAESSSARSVYLEEAARKGKPTEFRIQYDYTTKGVWFDLKPDAIQPIDPNDASVKEFIQEGPHVQFTAQMRALSDQITQGATNPCVKARQFYDWIADHIQYSFALEYSTIPNISDYCRSHGYGDCGQEALLFITLCRLNGIPARWQSGWNIFPGAKSNHDWTEIYLAPYGWVPVDPYMGIYATRYATTLNSEQRRELRDFYFGGLDQYRMIANSDHNQALTPRKQTMRSDDVDFQRGELEWNGHNLYFDQFSYDLTAKEIPLPAGKVE